MPVENALAVIETSVVNTAIQAIAAAIITLLGRVLLQTVPRHFLRYWIAGWASLTLALFAILWGFLQPLIQPAAFSVYCTFEYVAVLLWLAGVRNLACGTRITRSVWFCMIPPMLVGLILPHVFSGPMAMDAFFGVHLGIMAFLFLAAGVQLIWWWQRISSPGITVMTTAYFVLSALFLHTAVLSINTVAIGDRFAFPHLRYSALYDLLAQSALAFGMVMVVMETIRRELETVNQELRRSGNKLRELAHVDSLTGTLNRHAFDELMQSPDKSPANHGLAVVLDLDKLKVINDTLGHAVGDRAIQLVAAAVRTLIRADDLLFRWGGDEFVLLWFGVSKSDAEQRLTRLNAALAERVKSAGIKLPVALSASFGVATFASFAELNEAIKTADAAMYASKKNRGGAVST